MQLDAEENEDVFYKPPVEPVARPIAQRSSEESQGAATNTAENDDD
jgi:sorting nexin-1/2